MHFLTYKYVYSKFIKEVKYCELGELIYHIDGVKNYIFDTSVTKEYEGDCTKLYTLGAVSITVV